MKNYQIGANALTARFVLAIKSNADGQVKYKARYVIGGHRDRLKQYLVHGAQALQASSARLILAIAAIYDLAVWSCDVKLAYLQSAEPLTDASSSKTRHPSLNWNPTSVSNSYAPCTASVTLATCGIRHSTHTSLMIFTLPPPRLTPHSILPMQTEKLLGSAALTSTTLLRAGTPEFRTSSSKTHMRFESTGDEDPPFTFAGFNIAKQPDVPYNIDQLFYMKKLEELQLSSSFDQYRSMRMRLALACQYTARSPI